MVLIGQLVWQGVYQWLIKINRKSWAKIKRNLNIFFTSLEPGFISDVTGISLSLKKASLVKTSVSGSLKTLLS